MEIQGLVSNTWLVIPSLSVLMYVWNAENPAKNPVDKSTN